MAKKEDNDISIFFLKFYSYTRTRRTRAVTSQSFAHDQYTLPSPLYHSRLGKVPFTELLAIALTIPKKWKLNIINGTIHTGLSEILSDSYACGKRQIFTKDFTKEWVGYAISLASIAIAKESLFGIAIAKLSVNAPIVFFFTKVFSAKDQ